MIGNHLPFWVYDFNVYIYGICLFETKNTDINSMIKKFTEKSSER